MKINAQRIQEQSNFDNIVSKIQDYAYFETFIIVGIYLLVGYFINSDDVCLLHGQVSYMLILLAVITLFHGFENGLLALGLIGIAMWYFYVEFEYIEFLISLMMTLIFSEFHYFWTKKIKKAEVSADYRGTKLDELSKAFYTLKISHDQLEKNYVVKPMSIRNSIEQITNKNMQISKKITLDDRNEEYYNNFLILLDKSFNVKSAFIVYKKDSNKELLLSEKTASVCYGVASNHYDNQEIFNDYLVDKSLLQTKAVYVSDENGEPRASKTSKFITVLPATVNDKVHALLVIETMPFMAFNRENLTSVSILLEYFSFEIMEKNVLHLSRDIEIVKDEKFRYEYARLRLLYNEFDVSSIILVLRINNELQARRVYDRVIKMLRSLDMVTLVENNNYQYITLMFPLHDKSAALGYLNRLLSTLEEEKDKKFDYMTFNMAENNLFNKYLNEDYTNG